MPNAPLRFCPSPRCTQRVARGYCSQHRRPSAHKRGYTKQWDRFRTVYFPAMLVEKGIPPCCGARLASGPSRHSTCAAAGLVNFEGLELHHEPPLQDWEREHPHLVCDPDRVEFLCKPDHAAAGGYGGQRGGGHLNVRPLTHRGTPGGFLRADAKLPQGIARQDAPGAVNSEQGDGGTS
jgi:hypothetical protein